MKSTIWLAVCIVFLLETSTMAAECRSLPTVHQSTKSLMENTNLGGHVWTHVSDLHSKPYKASWYDTQKSKSLFTSESAFQSAWSIWHSGRVTMPIPKNCGGQASSSVDCIKASDIGIYKARRCTAVDESKVCINSFAFTPKSVKFVYKKRWGKWILRTAYPSWSNCR